MPVTNTLSLIDKDTACQYQNCPEIALRHVTINVLGEEQTVALCCEHAEEFEGLHLLQFPHK